MDIAGIDDPGRCHHGILQATGPSSQRLLKAIGMIIMHLLCYSLIPLLGFTMEGHPPVATNSPWAAWSPVGNLVARLMASLGMTAQGAAQLHDILWWVHAGVALAFGCQHPIHENASPGIYIPLNVIFRPLRKTGALEKIENIDQAEVLGVGKVTEFTSQQLLSFDACVNCGRCEEACPSNISGMDYSPRTLIQTLRQTMVNALEKSDGKSTRSFSPAPFAEVLSLAVYHLWRMHLALPGVYQPCR